MISILPHKTESVTIQRPINTQKRKHAWLNPESFATTLVVLFIDNYGLEALSWNPATILMEIADDNGIELPSGNVDKLFAGIHIVTQDDFYESLPTFVDMCSILGGASAGDVHVPDTHDCAWGITEALLLAPPDDKNEEPFSDDIRLYLAHILKNEGIISPPDVLKIALHGNIMPKISEDYSDDAEMFGSIVAAEKEKTDSINNLIKNELRRLLGQLQDLPLSKGNTNDLIEKMLKNLPK